jgi:hypothetical protein
MWEVAVVVFQVACVALLIAGAALCIWISWAKPTQRRRAEAPALVVVSTAPPAEHEASAPNTELKRAA